MEFSFLWCFEYNKHDLSLIKIHEKQKHPHNRTIQYDAHSIRNLCKKC